MLAKHFQCKYCRDSHNSSTLIGLMWVCLCIYHLCTDLVLSTFYFLIKEYASIIKEKNKTIEKLEGSLEKQQEGEKCCQRYQLLYSVKPSANWKINNYRITLYQELFFEKFSFCISQVNCFIVTLLFHKIWGRYHKPKYISF